MSDLITPELAKSWGASPEVRLKAAELWTRPKRPGNRVRTKHPYGFVKHVWPAFIEGRHHKIMAEAFERIARGELKRLIVNMPPRHTKSEFASYLLPAWFLGQMPDKKIIQTAHTAELSVGFGRNAKPVDSEDFKKVFPNLQLRADQKHGALEYQQNAVTAIGVGGADR